MAIKYLGLEAGDAISDSHVMTESMWIFNTPESGCSDSPMVFPESLVRGVIVFSQDDFEENPYDHELSLKAEKQKEVNEMFGEIDYRFMAYEYIYLVVDLETIEGEYMVMQVEGEIIKLKYGQ